MQPIVLVRDPSTIRNLITLELQRKKYQGYCPWAFVIATSGPKVLLMASAPSGAMSWGPVQARITGDNIEDAILSVLEMESGITNGTFNGFLGVARHVPENGEAPKGWAGKLLVAAHVIVPPGTVPSPSHQSVAACHWVSTSGELGGLMKIATGKDKRIITMTFINETHVWDVPSIIPAASAEYAQMPA